MWRREPLGMNPSVSASLILQMLWWALRFFRCAQLRSTLGKKRGKNKQKPNQETNTGCPKSKRVLEHQRKKKNMCVFFFFFALLTLTNSNAQVKQAKACFSTTLNTKILSNDIFPRPSILFSFFDFIQCLNHNAILWFSSFRGFNHTPRCSVHAPHLLCFSQTDAMVLLSFHTRSLTQANSRPLGKFKTGQGTMNHASQRKKKKSWLTKLSHR